MVFSTTEKTFASPGLSGPLGLPFWLVRAASLCSIPPLVSRVASTPPVSVASPTRAATTSASALVTVKEVTAGFRIMPDRIDPFCHSFFGIFLDLVDLSPQVVHDTEPLSDDTCPSSWTLILVLGHLAFSRRRVSSLFLLLRCRPSLGLRTRDHTTRAGHDGMGSSGWFACGGSGSAHYLLRSGR
ncbi:hypothetical protein AAMO2058_000051000 [Amorphochlora amoebiformis]